MQLLAPHSTVTGERVGPAVERCSLDPASDPLPPPPPTVDELWDAAGLPRPTIEVSPPGAGLVGFESWFWSNVPNVPVTVSVTLRGWTATVTAEPVAYEWDPGDGSDTLTAENPGDAEHPAATHPYIRQGAYEVTHSVVWRGTFRLEGYGITMTDEDLGTVRPSGTATYEVEEREAVIVG
jgi:hypothetical protein